ncbi:MAG: outer membrane protein assembly factor BamA, partial [Treponema sp.]|nr:outer membrane protein assembly factor BamA [Treponema sp.]
ETNTGDSSVTLNFHITEGEQISISRIEFQGNTRFTASTLRSQLSLKAKSLLNNGAFQEARLIADRETITRYYHDRGYIDAIVRDVTRTTETTERGSSLVLTFLIDEGSEFRFGGITFSGNSLFSSDQLQRLVSSRTGDIINRAKLEADMQRVADLYYENGYIFNSFSRVEARNTETNTISFAITITERSRAYIESITIVGNQRTNDNVILREIPLEPGDVFSRTKIMEAMRNLYNLQYFSMVIPETLPGSTENLMDLVFTFEEQMTTDLQFGLTFSGVADPDTFPISGLFKWTDRNLAGTGNELGAEINTSVIDTSTFSINYLHRWLLGMPFSLGVDFSANYNNRLALMDNQPPFFYGDEDYAFPDGFTSREEYEDTGIPTRDYLMNYEQWYISTGISSGYRWMTPLGIFGLNGGMRFGIVQNIYKNDLYRPFDPALRAGNNTWMPKNSLWLSLSLDQRDIFYDPSNGYYLYERLGLYGILNNEREHYMRSDTKVQYFLTLFNFQVTESWSFKSVLALHMGVSFLFSQPFRPDALTVEESNKLAVDGMFNARGWRSEYRSRKGFMLFDSWIELRFPIVQNFIALDLFFDAAGVETKQGDYFWGGNFTEENLRFSFGGSLRLALPQFPIRLSLAKRFRIEDGQVLWQAGDLFHDSTRPTSGMDLVFSIVMSY